MRGPGASGHFQLVRRCPSICELSFNHILRPLYVQSSDFLMRRVHRATPSYTVLPNSPLTPPYPPCVRSSAPLAQVSLCHLAWVLQPQQCCAPRPVPGPDGPGQERGTREGWGCPLVDLKEEHGGSIWTDLFHFRSQKGSKRLLEMTGYIMHMVP